MNRASALLETIQQKAVDRAHRAGFRLFLATGPAVALAWIAGAWGVLFGLLFAGIMALQVFVALRQAITGALVEAGTVYALCGRVVEFHILEPHIVGAE